MIDKIFDNCRDKYGYIDINKALDNNALTISQPSNSYTNPKIIGKQNNIKYFYKYNASSGGRFLGLKEMYETIISRLIKKFVKTVEYFPAIYNGEFGVLSTNWNNELNSNYMSVTRYLRIKSQNITDDDPRFIPRIMASTLSNYTHYAPVLEKYYFSPSIIQDILKLPQHLIVGNLDFKPQNLAINVNQSVPDTTLHFDYGYSMSCKVDNILDAWNEISNKKNISLAMDFIGNEMFIGMGIDNTKYSTIDEFWLEMTVYARTHPEFIENIKTALSLQDGDIVETLRSLREDEHLIIPQRVETIMRTTHEYRHRELENIINRLQ